MKLLITEVSPVFQPGGWKQTVALLRSYRALGFLACFGVGGFWLLGGVAVAFLGTIFLFFMIAVAACPSLSRKTRLAFCVLWCIPWAMLYLVWRWAPARGVVRLEVVFAWYLVPIVVMIVMGFVILRLYGKHQERLVPQPEVRRLLVITFVTLFLVVGLVFPQAFPRHERTVDNLFLTETIRDIRESIVFSWAEMRSGPLRLLGVVVEFDSEMRVRWISVSFRSTKTGRSVVFYSKGGDRFVFQIQRRPDNPWEPLYEEDELESSLEALDKKGLAGLVQEILQLCREANVVVSSHVSWLLSVGPAYESKGLEMVMRAYQEASVASRIEASPVVEAYYHPENVALWSFCLGHSCSDQ